MLIRNLVSAAVLALTLGGCAIDHHDGRQVVTNSVKRSDRSAGTASRSANETMKAFCAQRHVDYQVGKAPGGAKTPEQKAADDRLCEALGRQG